MTAEKTGGRTERHRWKRTRLGMPTEDRTHRKTENRLGGEKVPQVKTRIEPSYQPKVLRNLERISTSTRLLVFTLIVSAPRPVVKGSIRRIHSDGKLHFGAQRDNARVRCRWLRILQRDVTRRSSVVPATLAAPSAAVRSTVRASSSTRRDSRRQSSGACAR